ncbi:MAG: 50S ribosomal protein L32 [Phycisphaerales bacterium]|nr:50S ribosomal protein L32 [Phycisphaerales bacterium]
MLPNQKVSYGRTRRRRNHHAMTPITVTTCPISGMPKQHHRVSAESGYVRAGLRISVPKLGIGIDQK